MSFDTMTAPASSTVHSNGTLDYFDFHSMMNSDGNNIGNFSNPGGVNYYADLCLSKLECSGFNSYGWLKHSIRDKEQWYPISDIYDPNKGLYVKKEFNMPSSMPSISAHPTISQSPSSDPSSSNAPSLSPTLFCGGSNATESLFYLKLKTDIYPSEIYWALIDASTSEVVHSVKRGHFQSPGTIYNEALCIPHDSCYQFILYDSFGDGIHSSGYYKIFYENNVVMDIQGRNFGYSELSSFFGQCRTPNPSVSFAPSVSRSPFASLRTSSPSPPSDEVSPILGYIYVGAFFVIALLICLSSLCCCRAQRSPTDSHNNSQRIGNQRIGNQRIGNQPIGNHLNFSIIEEQMQNRRLKIMSNIIHKVWKKF